MPEVHMDIVWPNDKPDRVYSPSTVIRNYFQSGDELTVAAFQSRIKEALSSASERVKARFGFECTSAMGELARLTTEAGHFQDKNAVVRIVHIE